VAFQVLNLNDAPRETIEQLGTKQKYWTTIPELGRRLCETARPGTGEDWSEVVAAEIASLMGLPHAQYFLGDYNGEPVVVTPSFLQGRSQRSSWEMRYSCRLTPYMKAPPPSSTLFFLQAPSRAPVYPFCDTLQAT
jgi:hypothetical protein